MACRHCRNKFRQLCECDLILAVVTKIATYSITSLDDVILCNGTFTVSLPSAIDLEGKVFHIVNIGTGLVTLQANGLETIDGSNSVLIPDQYTNIQIVSDDNNWYIL